jgi:hypothetical protein
VSRSHIVAQLLDGQAQTLSLTSDSVLNSSILPRGTIDFTIPSLWLQKLFLITREHPHQPSFFFFRDRRFTPITEPHLA